jgi:hypothetical protein
LENRVQRSNSNFGTAMTSGVLVSEATAIASLKPRRNRAAAQQAAVLANADFRDNLYAGGD